MSEGDFVNMTPHVADKKGQLNIDESTDTYDTIEWLLENMSKPQRPGGEVGDLLSRLLHRRQHDRRPSGPEGGFAPGAHRRLVVGRLPPPWCSFLPHAFNFLSVFGAPGPAHHRAAPSFRPWTPDGYQFFLDMGPLGNANRLTSRTRSISGTR